MNDVLDGLPEAGPKAAVFISRNDCLSCGSRVREIAAGRFEEEPLRSLIAADPWGENPLPHLKDACWEYVQCEVCHLAFHRQILSPEWNARRFDRWMTADAIAEFERTHTTAHSRFERGAHYVKHVLQIEELTRQLRGDGPARVLDFGCGNGEFIRQCTLFGFEAIGIDRSTARKDKNLSPVYADIPELGSQKFHAVSLFEVLEHLDDPRSILDALSAHLVRDGILILETPDCTNVAGIRNPHEYAMINPLDHINGFTPETLRCFAERLGFKPLSTPASYVATDLKHVAKTAAKRWLKFAVPARTQQYFVKR